MWAAYDQRDTAVSRGPDALWRRVKMSGSGREGPRYAIEEMTEPKADLLEGIKKLTADSFGNLTFLGPARL